MHWKANIWSESPLFLCNTHHMYDPNNPQITFFWGTIQDLEIMLKESEGTLLISVLPGGISKSFLGSFYCTFWTITYHLSIYLFLNSFKYLKKICLKFLEKMVCSRGRVKICFFNFHMVYVIQTKVTKMLMWLRY